MSETHEHQAEQTPASQHQGAQKSPALPGATGEIAPIPLATAASLLGDPGLNGRGNGPVRTAIMQRMQATVGNRAVQRAVRQADLQRSPAAAPHPSVAEPPAVQRAPPAGATATAPAPATPVVWHAPFSLGDATDRPHAVLALLQISQKTTDLQEMLPPEMAHELDSDQNALHTLMQRLSGEGPLTSDDLGALSFGTGMIEARHTAKVEAMASALAAALNKFLTPVDTSVMEAQLAEELHNAFLEGATDRIGKAKGGIGKLKEYNGKVGTVAEWAGKAAGAVGAAKTVEALKKVKDVTGNIGTLIGHVQDVLTVAGAFATLAGIDNQAGGDAQNSINQFRAGLAAIDVAMTFAKAVPIIGTLWSSYYKPLTEACLKLLTQIARAVDKEGRDLTLLEWMQKPRDAGVTPQIPKELLQFFPGGQEMLNFMYPLVNGGTPQVTPGVEKFVLAKRQLLNAGQGGDELKSQSNWHLLSPSSWGASDSAPDLLPWAQRNANTLWSQLYGSMPHALR